jgi:hypothetical protein
MNRRLILILTVGIIFTYCSTSENKKEQTTLDPLVVEENVNATFQLNEEVNIVSLHVLQQEFPRDIYYYEEKLYLLSDSLTLVDVNTREVSGNLKLNKRIRHYSDKYNGVNQIIVRNGKIYLSFLNGVLILNSTGEVLGALPFDFNVDFFNVKKDGIISVISGNEIKYYNETGDIVREIKLEGVISGNILFEGDTVIESSYNKLYFYDLSTNNVLKKKLNIDEKDIPLDDPYLAGVFSEYFVWYSYTNRNKLLFQDKGFKKRKIISVAEESLVTKDEVIDEEGVPNFRVVEGNEKYYVVSKGKNKENIEIIFLTFN